MRCTTPQSWQGSPLRAPVASLRPWLFLGIEPIQSHQNVSPFHHSQETSLSLHPSIKGAIAPLVKSTRQGNSPRHLPIRGAFLLPPIPHDHFMETNPARFGCRSGLSRPDTYDQEPPRALWIHGPTLRRLDKRQHFAAGLRPRKCPWMQAWAVEESSKYRWHIVYPKATLIA